MSTATTYAEAAIVLDKAADLLTNDKWTEGHRGHINTRMCAVGAIDYAATGDTWGSKGNHGHEGAVARLARQVADQFVDESSDKTLNVRGRGLTIMMFNDNYAKKAWRVRRALRGAAGRARRLAREASKGAGK